MKVLVLITDSAGYKSYLELKNYLHYNNTNVELNYHYINADLDDIKFDSSNFIGVKSRLVEAFEGEDEILSKYYDACFNIKKKYGYAIARTMFIKSFLIVLKNYINNTKYLLDNLDTGEYLTTIKYKNYENYIEFENQYDKIPEADLYILSDRNGACNSALLTIQLSIILYLHRKYKYSHIIIGGGRNNTKNNPITNIFNAIGSNYVEGQLEFCVGDIGSVISNYINEVNYNHSYGMNKSEVLNLDISEYEMEYVLKNEFGISFSKGCINNCPFCIGHNSSRFDIINNFDIYTKYFTYLNQKYPNVNINIFDNEINHTKGYFTKFMNYILKLNVNNPITIFLDVKMITPEDIVLMKQYKNLNLSISADYLDIDNKIDIVKNFNTMYKQLKNNNINVKKIYIVANIPNFKTINNKDFIEIFKTSYGNSIYEDYRLEFSSDMYIYSKDYNITFSYYNNTDKDFINIEKELNALPIMYYRNDYNRKELLNEKYKLLNKLNGYLLLINRSKLYGNNLIESLVFNCYLYKDLIDNKSAKLDNMISEFINNV